MTDLPTNIEAALDRDMEATLAKQNLEKTRSQAVDLTAYDQQLKRWYGSMRDEMAREFYGQPETRTASFTDWLTLAWHVFRVIFTKDITKVFWS